MCTLVLVVPPPGGVLQVAANRDEFLARPASPPEASADRRPEQLPATPIVLEEKDASLLADDHDASCLAAIAHRGALTHQNRAVLVNGNDQTLSRDR